MIAAMITAVEDPRGSRPERPGPIYDRVMRRLAHTDVAGLCGLLGVELDPAVPASARLLPTTLAGRTQTVDLLVRSHVDGLLHVEYQRNAGPGLALRMLEYRAAIMAANPGDRLRQAVVVLGDGSLDSIDDGRFRLGCSVLHLRDVATEELLRTPTLAPLAVLGRGTEVDRAAAHLQALRLIRDQAGERLDELVETATVLATIRLHPHTIEKIRREADMTVESIADFYAQTEGGQFLIAKGREEGREETREETLAVLLRARFGDDPRIPALADRLVHEQEYAAVLRAVLGAESLDDL